MKTHQKLILALIFLNVGILAIAHEGHPKKHDLPKTVQEKSSLTEINEKYLKGIKPIFQKKCFDCHSSQTQFPWYSKVPWVKQFIQNDIDEAKKHLDFENDFPFRSHSEPLEDLDAIDITILKNEMPPLSYRLLHSGSSLTPDEKEIVHQWVQFGKYKLKEITKK